MLSPIVNYLALKVVNLKQDFKISSNYNKEYRCHLTHSFDIKQTVDILEYSGHIFKISADTGSNIYECTEYYFLIYKCLQ